MCVCVCVSGRVSVLYSLTFKGAHVGLFCAPLRRADASSEDIIKAYCDLARTMHPEINNAPDAELKFAELTQVSEW